jgi:tetratricopeptide (TPR) repeat protein
MPNQDTEEGTIGVQPGAGRSRRIMTLRCWGVYACVLLAAAGVLLLPRAIQWQIGTEWRAARWVMGGMGVAGLAGLIVWSTVVGARGTVAAAGAPKGRRRGAFVVGLLASGSLAAGIGTNLVSSKIDRHWENGLPSQEKFYHNHDSARLVGQTVRMMVLRFRDAEKDEEARKTLTAIADRVPDGWEILSKSTDPADMALLRPGAVTAGASDAVVAAVLLDPAQQALDAERWGMIISRFCAEAGAQPLAPDVQSRLASSMGGDFASSFRESAKYAWERNDKAWASLEIDMFLRLKESIQLGARQQSEEWRAEFAVLHDRASELYAMMDQWPREAKENHKALIVRFDGVMAELLVLRRLAEETKSGVEDANKKLDDQGVRLADMQRMMSRSHDSTQVVDQFMDEMRSEVAKVKEQVNRLVAATPADSDAIRAELDAFGTTVRTLSERVEGAALLAATGAATGEELRGATDSLRAELADAMQRLATVEAVGVGSQLDFGTALSEVRASLTVVQGRVDSIERESADRAARGADLERIAASLGETADPLERAITLVARASASGSKAHWSEADDALAACDAISASGAKWTPEQEYLLLVARGDRAYFNGDTEDALDVYKSAVALRPFDTLALGRVRRANASVARARRASEEMALRMEPVAEPVPSSPGAAWFTMVPRKHLTVKGDALTMVERARSLEASMQCTACSGTGQRVKRVPVRNYSRSPDGQLIRSTEYKDEWYDCDVCNKRLFGTDERASQLLRSFAQQCGRTKITRELEPKRIEALYDGVRAAIVRNDTTLPTLNDEATTLFSRSEVSTDTPVWFSGSVSDRAEVDNGEGKSVYLLLEGPGGRDVVVIDPLLDRVSAGARVWVFGLCTTIHNVDGSRMVPVVQNALLVPP